MSVYGGSAWEYDYERGECYLHTFFKEEPDLNLRNPEVLKEMEVCKHENSQKSKTSAIFSIYHDISRAPIRSQNTANLNFIHKL